MENDILRVRVLSLGAALAAGFVPDAGLLRSKDDGSINQNVFVGHSGKVHKAFSTGHEEFPVTIEGVIYPAGLISLEVQKQEFKSKDGSKRELVRFDDGSLVIDFLNGQYEVLSVDTIAGVHTDGKKAASKKE